MAKYMLIMRATDEALEKFQSIGFDEILEGMGRFNDELSTVHLPHRRRSSTMSILWFRRSTGR